MVLAWLARLRGVLTLEAAVILLFMLAACGSSGETHSNPPASPTQTTALSQADESTANRPPPGTSSWSTDWSKHSVPLSEIIPGGVPRDGIPPIDKPKFESVADVTWLVDREPVVAFRLGEDARAYPLRILILHEIVNDTVNYVPVAVTYCPLCNSAVVFDRRLDNEILRFGVSGLLRNSDLIMWDNETESLWQQITGEAVVGALTGKQLTFYPSAIVPWSEFAAAHPEGKVLSRDTGIYPPDSYGVNPYSFYDDPSSRPFLFDGKPDPRLPAMERVVVLKINGAAVAYPFSVLSTKGVVHDNVGGQDVVVFWGAADTASALSESNIATARGVGAATVWDPVVDGRRLTFIPNGDSTYTDQETGTVWSLMGLAISGPLVGKGLAPVTHGNYFWFAWAAFNPDTRVYAP